MFQGKEEKKQSFIVKNSRKSFKNQKYTISLQQIIIQI